MYHLYSLGEKNIPNLKHLLSGTKNAMGRELTSRQNIDKRTLLGIYNDRGILLSSTASGGASPHTWDTRASGKSRKLSGLSAYKRH